MRVQKDLNLITRRGKFVNQYHVTKAMNENRMDRSNLNHYELIESIILGKQFKTN